MINDKLTTEQRIRLEAMNQANQRFAMAPMNKNDFFRAVQDFEEYIRTGNIAFEPEDDFTPAETQQ